MSRRTTSSAARRRRGLLALGAVAMIASSAAGCGGAGSAQPVAALDPNLVTPGKLTVCTSVPYRPFEFQKGGKTVGFDIDLASAVADELGVEPVFVNSDFDEIQSGQLLNDGTCDLAAAGLTINGDRARVLDFSSPYFDASQALVVKTASGLDSLAAMTDRRIGVQTGSTGEIYVSDNAPASSTMIRFSDADQIDRALGNGQIDAGVYDNSVVGIFVQRHPAFQIAEEFSTSEQYGMAVKKNSNNDLLRVVDDVLSRLRTDGTYDDLYLKWFGTEPPSGDSSPSATSSP